MCRGDFTRPTLAVTPRRGRRSPLVHLPRPGRGAGGFRPRPEISRRDSALTNAAAQSCSSGRCRISTWRDRCFRRRHRLPVIRRDCRCPGSRSPPRSIWCCRSSAPRETAPRRLPCSRLRISHFGCDRKSVARSGPLDARRQNTRADGTDSLPAPPPAARSRLLSPPDPRRRS